MAHYDTTGQFNCNWTGLGGKACYIGCYNSMWGGPESATWWPYTEDGSCTNTATHCTQSFEWFQDFCDTVGTHDCCGVPDGDGTSCPDCCGIDCGDGTSCDGCCGPCNDSSSCDGCCGPCNDNSSCDGVCGACNDNTSCLDCCGVPNGSEDTCDGICGSCNDNSSCIDECGVPNGDGSSCDGSSDFCDAMVTGPCLFGECTDHQYEMYCCYYNCWDGWCDQFNGTLSCGGESQQNNGILVRGSRKRKGSLGNKKAVNKR